MSEDDLNFLQDPGPEFPGEAELDVILKKLELITWGSFSRILFSHFKGRSSSDTNVKMRVQLTSAFTRTKRGQWNAKNKFDVVR